MYGMCIFERCCFWVFCPLTLAIPMRPVLQSRQLTHPVTLSVGQSALKQLSQTASLQPGHEHFSMCAFVSQRYERKKTA